MEPVTHILTGACLARTGLNRRAAYTTLTMAVAAEFPDIDTLWGLRGPVASFQHHRGMTHTFVGIPFEAALLVGGVYGLHQWRLRRAVRDALAGKQKKPLNVAPVRWPLLYLFALLALLSHLLLDYTNNYGLRPFFPFNPRWYAASITFIFDPAMFLLLLAALVLPPLFGLVSSEVGARRQPFAARGWAVAALLGVVSLWAWRAVEHSRAVALAAQQSLLDPAGSRQPETPDGGVPADPSPLAISAPPLRYLSPGRVLASPDPIDPWRWYTVADFGPAYQLGTVDLRAGTYATQMNEGKPAPSAALEAAERSQLGRAYLDWSPMPLLASLPAGSDVDRREEPPVPGAVVVTFRDPRFMGESPWLHMARHRSALTGTVEVDAQGQVLRETMDGKVQR